MNNKFYVYIHRKATTGEVFYVGKGTGKRSHIKATRSDYWKSVVAKHGYTIDYIDTELDENTAFELEMLAIETIGIENLCNHTIGGEGICGYKWTKEQIDNHPMKRPEMRDKYSKMFKGKKIPHLSGENHPLKNPETAKKVSEKLKGRPNPYATGSNHGNAKKVKCVETGLIFDYMTAAVDWLSSIGKEKPSAAGICTVCKGRRNKYAGYHWEYV